MQTAIGNTRNHFSSRIHIQFACRVIIEEKQRLSALNNQIIDAHRHQIDTYGVVFFHIQSETQFGTYAVSARD
ncbi:Uncharacterised protein [Vibrio cholerae]|nr:Uncharacterised protein [Vibrio cholerae]CSC05431.1 Uncharacterised protein [Vibrio cholerae]